MDSKSVIGLQRELKKLNNEINAALVDPKAKARISAMGATAFASSPADFGNSSPMKPRCGPR